MKFYQHIYGRVARGYRTSYSGYQVAALTDSLLDHSSLISKLNRYSFFHACEGEGNNERYSFYSPVAGWLAFGCSRLVRDATGSIGSFAHHYLCDERDFLEAKLSPLALLKSLPFIKSEDEIGSSRSLPVYELSGVEPSPGVPEWRAFALSLIDTYLGESVLVVPMVVLREAETWDLLAELFALLPQLEASRLSFSTLFKDATDFVDEFRLVFVPDQSIVSRNVQIYRVLDPGPERKTFEAPSRPVPFTAFWRSTEATAPALITLINLLRQSSERPANMDMAAELLPKLLGSGPLFRDTIESLGVTEIYSLLVRQAKWLVAYGRAGKALDTEAVCAAVRGNASPAFAYLLPALDAADQLQQGSLSTAFFESLARHVVARRDDLFLVQQIAEAGWFARFCEIISHSERLTDRELELLAEQLCDKPYYSGELHQVIARKLLNEIGEVRPEETRRRGQWLKDESKQMTNQFVLSTAALCEWIEEHPSRRGYFSLQNYQFATAAEYEDILPLAWRASARYEWKDRIRIIYHSNYRAAFFNFCARCLKQYEFGEQKQFLGTLVQMSKPYGNENQALIDGVLGVKKFHELAQYYAAVLEDLAQLDSAAIRSLKSLKPEKSWLSFWRN
jgi:hypothetical protein